MTGRTKRRLAAWLLVSVTAALVAAGCGGGGSSGSASAGTSTGPSKVAVSDWIGSVCTSVGKWQKTLFKTPDISNPTDLEATKNAVAGFLGKVVTATGTLLAEVKAAGVPDTQDGEAIASALTGSLSSVGDAFQSAKSEVDGLSTSDPGALASGLQKIATDLTAAGTKVTTTFDDLAKKHPAADLGKAMQDNPACSAIAGSFSATVGG